MTEASTEQAVPSRPGRPDSPGTDVGGETFATVRTKWEANDRAIRQAVERAQARQIEEARRALRRK